MAVAMTALADQPQRLRALTDLDATLLVEAAAGTGKTALMAGRVTMLLVRGVDPSNIAAITFTKLAASELAARVHAFVDELLTGPGPKPLRPALPHGLDPAQRATLTAAAGKLDELTADTIHGFCQTLIRSYAVEADIDPGARMLDEDQAALVFDNVFDQWIRGRLGGPAIADDPVVTLSRDDPRKVISVLRKLARFRRDHRDAGPEEGIEAGRPDLDFEDAVESFSRWLAQSPPEPKTAEFVGHLAALCAFYSGCFEQAPDFPQLWRLANPERLPCMRPNCFDLAPPRLKTAWQRAAGAEAGARLNEEAERHFARVDECYRVLVGCIARQLVSVLSHELDGMLADYEAFKRAAAVLDFDDLLHRARFLVRSSDPVRRELHARYQHIFIDEFQDTDRIQAEILFRIASDDCADAWQESLLTPGALFLVGDPKQAIYGFRGADIECYLQARAAIARRWPDNVLQITANFRSRPEILAHINQCFEPTFSSVGQPPYVSLTPTVAPPIPGTASIVKLRPDLPSNAFANDIREAEAAAVAELCLQLIGEFQIRTATGLAAASPSDIALLAPAWTDLWRYERALDRRGLPIASQAGKGLFRRQEFQDLLALTRMLAEPRDTLAFGAFMRGSFVGLSEQELLDITAELDSADTGAPPRFSLQTEPDQVAHPVARQVLTVLRDLLRRGRRTAPMLLLAEAVERLAIKPILAARSGDQGARAIANVEAFIERARPYGVRGLKYFARDLSAGWSTREACLEGRIDPEDSAIEIVTIHSAKGLEWPIVIPINTSTLRPTPEALVHRRADNTLHWILGAVVPPDLRLALRAENEKVAREQERLLYVACTRARDLLVIPDIRAADQYSWARMVDLRQRDLPSLNPGTELALSTAMIPATTNLQTTEIFEAEADAIAQSTIEVRWIRPSDRDADRIQVAEVAAIDVGDPIETDLPAGGGRLRGLVLHKLMEELLTGEVEETLSVVASRATTLVRELAFGEAQTELPDSEEIAATALGTLRLPDIDRLRHTLVPELPVYGLVEAGENCTALAGRADAVAFEGGKPSIVIDWKSDIALTAKDVEFHASQLRDYMTALGAAHGAVVYMTVGTVHWLDVMSAPAAG
jgi:ATP-dependent exoDNAse (exonuclease V) beta subunit